MGFLSMVTFCIIGQAVNKPLRKCEYFYNCISWVWQIQVSDMQKKKLQTAEYAVKNKTDMNSAFQWLAQNSTFSPTLLLWKALPLMHIRSLFFWLIRRSMMHHIYQNIRREFFLTFIGKMGGGGLTHSGKIEDCEGQSSYMLGLLIFE